MNLDRFGMKAISQRTNKWVFANFIESFKDCFGLLWGDSKEDVYYATWVYPETICQCTGLKDSDGKLIYENDYLKITGKEGNIEKALVRYDENILEYLLIFNKSELPIRFFQMWMEEGKKCYVVGNKFDKEEE